jgi:hypothetical protein
LIDDDSDAEWCAATERSDHEEPTKRKILRNWIMKEMKHDGGRFSQGATSVAESEAMSFLQTSDNGNATNAALNKLRQQKSLNRNKRVEKSLVSLTAPPVQALHLNVRAVNTFNHQLWNKVVRRCC